MLFVLVGLFGLLVSPDAGARPKVAKAYIQRIEVRTSWDASNQVSDAQAIKFRELLQAHGYRAERCERSLEGLRNLAGRAEHMREGDGGEGYRRIEQRERVLSTEVCEVPEAEQLVYDATILLDVDKIANNRRAVLLLDPLGAGHMLSGGYAHKPGDTMGWRDLMNRAIERTLGEYNERTAIKAIVPDDAEVGETLHIDGRQTWDPDGDAFELRWKVQVDACAGGERPVPVDGHGCPDGTVRGMIDVSSQAGTADRTRDFVPPIVGDYEILVHSKVGARDEPAGIYRVRAEPQRANTIFSRISPLRLPRNFIESTGEQDLGVVIGLGYLRRVAHRIGLLGWYEDIYLGVSLGSLARFEDFPFSGGGGTLLGLEVHTRTLDRTGRYGLVIPMSLSGASIVRDRQGDPRAEWGWSAEVMLGAYMAFGEGYTARSTSLCADFCPSVTVGPTLWVVQNSTIEKTAALGGFEALMGIEF